MADNDKSGHREKLRQRFLSGDDISQTDEAVLELLLSYAIPQKDVRPLANKLMFEFGSLQAVLSADVRSLIGFDGIKQYSAVLFKLVDFIRTHSTINEMENTPPCFPDAQQRPLFASEQLNHMTPSIEDQFKNNTQATEDQVPPHGKEAIRRQTEIFGKAVLRESIRILPKIPQTTSVKEVTDFLNKNLPFNSEQTRVRRGRYIKYNMFPKNAVDFPLLKFARAFPETRGLKDVCYYRFCRAQPLMMDFVENIVLPNMGSGSVTRDDISGYLRFRFPGSKAIDDGTAAICEALVGAEVACKKGNRVSFSFRSIPLSSFAFVLHSEFPAPGMYDISKLEENRAVKAMLWNPDRILPSLYELRNQGIISKISEIDSMRQFTTKWKLDEVVVQLVRPEEQA